MKAMLLREPLKFESITMPEPGEPGPGEALVRVHRVGICGTDYSGYLGKMPFFSYPRIPGHELGVEIVALGPGSERDEGRVKVGDHCAVEPYINCQRCFTCQRGHTNCCENHQTLGVHCDGGLRPWFIVPARKLHVSHKLTFDQLALTETLAIGCHAVARSSLKAGETILVIGAGPIGLTVIEFAKIAGARVIVMDISESRLEFVRTSMGIQETLLVESHDQTLKTFTDLTNGKLGQVVVDATGHDGSMSRALEYVGFAGRLVFVGITTKEIHFPHPLMHRREMTLFASRNALSADFGHILRLIEDGQINTQPWLSHRASFDAMIDEFPRWLEPRSGVIKAIVEIN